MILKKKKSYFEERIAKDRNKPKKLWKPLESFGLNFDKASKSKISLKIQFEALENANIFRKLYLELADDLKEKMPKVPNKFTSLKTKNY